MIRPQRFALYILCLCDGGISIVGAVLVVAVVVALVVVVVVVSYLPRRFSAQIV